MISRHIAAAAIFALAATAGTAHAQTSADLAEDAVIAQMRKDLRGERSDVVTGTMEFTSDEAAKFWPLYKKYETQRKAIGDEQVALIKDYVAHYDGMKDAQATDILGRMMSIEDKAMAAKRAFVKDLQKVLSPRTVARYYQVERRLDMLVDLELASQLPVIK